MNKKSALYISILANIVMFVLLLRGVLPDGGDFSDFLCTVDIVKEIEAPNRKKSALLYSKGCGATTGTTKNVVIKGVNEKFEEDKETPLLVAEADDINVGWNGNSELIITIYENYKIHIMTTAYLGTEIIYEMKSK